MARQQLYLQHSDVRLIQHCLFREQEALTREKDYTASDVVAAYIPMLIAQLRWLYDNLEVVATDQEDRLAMAKEGTGRVDDLPF